MIRYRKNAVKVRKTDGTIEELGAIGEGKSTQDLTDELDDVKNDLEELSEEVEGKASTESVQNLNNSKLSKPTSGIAVGKYFRVASIDSEGNPVLEACDLPSASIVKSGMTSATDPEWTDAEKLSARQRMGDEWETILDLTTTEEIGITSFTALPKTYSQYKVVCISNSSGACTTSYSFIQLCRGTSTLNGIITIPFASYGNNGGVGFLDMKHQYNIRCFFGASVTNTGLVGGSSFDFSDWENFTHYRIYTNSSKTIPVGVRIMFYGKN